MAEIEGFIEHGEEFRQDDLGEEEPRETPVVARREAPLSRQSLTVGGQSYEMEAGLAQALNDERTGWEAERQQTQRDLQGYREWQGRVQDTVMPPRQGEQQGGAARADLWTDPAQYEQQLEARITSNLSARYQKAEDVKLFWNAFDDEFPRLKKYRGMAERVVSQSTTQFQGLSLLDARAKLAEQVTSELMDIASDMQHQTPDVRTSRLRVVESGGADVPRTTPAAPGSSHADTLSGNMKERRQQRRQRSA